MEKDFSDASGDVFKIRYVHEADNYAKTDRKIGSFKTDQNGDIKIDLLITLVTGQMFIRAKRPVGPQNG